MERLITTRLMWHLEQAAYRQDRSPEDQITSFSQAINDASLDKKHTRAVWTDLEKAFDEVSKEGLNLKLHQCCSAGRMHKWTGQYLHNMKAKVQVKHNLSKKKTLSKASHKGECCP